MTADPHQWDAFVHMMGDPDWAGWEIFNDRFKRGENRDALRPLLQDWDARAHRPGSVRYVG